MKKLILISALLFIVNGWADNTEIEHFSSEQTIKQDFPFSDAVKVDNTLYLFSDHEKWHTGGQRVTTYSTFFKSPLHNGGYGGLGAERLFADFLNASRNGKTAPTPIEDLVHVLQIGEAIRESSNSKRSISILPI